MKKRGLMRWCRTRFLCKIECRRLKKRVGSALTQDSGFSVFVFVVWLSVVEQKNVKEINLRHHYLSGAVRSGDVIEKSWRNIKTAGKFRRSEIYICYHNENCVKMHLFFSPKRLVVLKILSERVWAAFLLTYHISNIDFLILRIR